MILDLVPIGLAITLEPVPPTAFILVLSSKEGVRKGAAFIFGWLLSLAAVIAITVLVTGNKSPAPSTAQSLGALAAKIAVGVVLVYFAVRQRRRMGRPMPPKKTPKWQTGIDTMSPWYAIGLAPSPNPGYWLSPAWPPSPRQSSPPGRTTSRSSCSASLP